MSRRASRPPAPVRVPRGPAPVIPGLTSCRPSTATGRGPWTARDSATGQRLVVEEVSGAVLQNELGSVPDHPNLLVPRLVHDTTGRPWLVVNHRSYHSMGEVLGQVGALSPGQVATVGDAVGRALGALHTAGLVHGSVHRSTVLITPAGRPVLHCGALATGPDPTSSPPGDVADLAALLTELLGGPGRSPVNLAPVLATAAHPDPLARPDALSVARQIRTAQQTQAIEVVPRPDQPAPGRQGEPWRQRPRGAESRPHATPPGLGPVARAARVVAGPWARLGGAAAAALAAAVALGVSWAGAAAPTTQMGVLGAPERRSELSGQVVHPPTAGTGGTSGTTPLPWVTVLSQLDNRRLAAFADTDPGLLGGVDAPGSPAYASDMSVIQAMARAGLQARGYSVRVLGVRVLRLSPGRASLLVRDVRASYDLVADGTAVVASRAARGPADWLVELIRSGPGWLVRSVQPR